eukprot:558277-Hanusia_phi.AAC.2
MFTWSERSRLDMQQEVSHQFSKRKGQERQQLLVIMMTYKEEEDNDNDDVDDENGDDYDLKHDFSFLSEDQEDLNLLAVLNSAHSSLSSLLGN